MDVSYLLMAGQSGSHQRRAHAEAIVVPGVGAVAYRASPAEWGEDHEKQRHLWLERRASMPGFMSCKHDVHPQEKEEHSLMGGDRTYPNNSNMAFGRMTAGEIAYRKRLSGLPAIGLQGELDLRFGSGACDYASATTQGLAELHNKVLGGKPYRYSVATTDEASRMKMLVLYEAEDRLEKTGRSLNDLVTWEQRAERSQWPAGLEEGFAERLAGASVQQLDRLLAAEGSKYGLGNRFLDEVHEEFYIPLNNERSRLIGRREMGGDTDEVRLASLNRQDAIALAYAQRIHGIENSFANMVASYSRKDSLGVRDTWHTAAKAEREYRGGLSKKTAEGLSREAGVLWGAATDLGKMTYRDLFFRLYEPAERRKLELTMEWTEDKQPGRRDELQAGILAEDKKLWLVEEWTYRHGRRDAKIEERKFAPSKEEKYGPAYPVVKMFGIWEGEDHLLRLAGFMDKNGLGPDSNVVYVGPQARTDQMALIAFKGANVLALERDGNPKILEEARQSLSYYPDRDPDPALRKAMAEAIGRVQLVYGPDGDFLKHPIKPGNDMVVLSNILDDPERAGGFMCISGGEDTAIRDPHCIERNGKLIGRAVDVLKDGGIMLVSCVYNPAAHFHQAEDYMRRVKNAQPEVLDSWTYSGKMNMDITLRMYRIRKG
ncbi:MAG: hypothetical protein PHG85_01620 [Candidatus Altiarchaeota archaeon]|nr:hypothetical protein [Candidatus Altiarchaeota archaeon]